MSHPALKSQSSLSGSELINHVKSTQQPRCQMQVSVCFLSHNAQLPLPAADGTAQGNTVGVRERADGASAWPSTRTRGLGTGQ